MPCPSEEVRLQSGQPRVERVLCGGHTYPSQLDPLIMPCFKVRAFPQHTERRVRREGFACCVADVAAS